MKNDKNIENREKPTLASDDKLIKTIIQQVFIRENVSCSTKLRK